LVVGGIEHADARHLIIRRPDGATFLLPEWMTGQDARFTRIIACPRLPVNRVIELRALVDRLLASSSGERIPTGEDHEEIEDTAAASIRANATSQQSVGAAAREGVLLKSLLMEALCDHVVEIEIPARKGAGHDQDHS